jgi:hypothetical protein
MNTNKRRWKTKKLHLSYRRCSAFIGGQIAFFSILLREGDWEVVGLIGSWVLPKAGEVAPRCLTSLLECQTEMKDARITVRLPIALRRQLKRTAITEGVRESDLIRDAVERRVAEKDAIVTAYDRAKKAGIIGIVRDTPPDLSTNKKHFDGFGK